MLALSEDIRAGMEERFPGVTALEFVDGFDSLQENSTVFTIHVPTGSALSVETAEQAKRTFSSIVEEVVRTHGLRVDGTTLVYYAGGRFGAAAYRPRLHPSSDRGEQCDVERAGRAADGELRCAAAGRH